MWPDSKHHGTVSSVQLFCVDVFACMYIWAYVLDTFSSHMETELREVASPLISPPGKTKQRDDASMWLFT